MKLRSRWETKQRKEPHFDWEDGWGERRRLPYAERSEDGGTEDEGVGRLESRAEKRLDKAEDKGAEGAPQGRKEQEDEKRGARGWDPIEQASNSIAEYLRRSGHSEGGGHGPDGEQQRS